MFGWSNGQIHVTDNYLIHYLDLFKDDPFNVLPVAWAIRPGNPRLLTFLNNMLDYMDTNGIWQAVAGDYKDTGLYLAKRGYEPLKPR